MVNPISNNQTSSTGRSADADQIYQQYVNYYDDINNIINEVNKIPGNSISSTARAQYINKLVSFQSELYPIYQSQYNNSNATLTTFNDACSSIIDQASQLYEEVLNTYPTSSDPSPIDIFSNANSSSGTSTSSSTGTTSSSSGTTTTSTSSSTSGRSADANLIYNQYVSYYNDINSKINSINQLPSSILNQASVTNIKKELVSLQQQLYPLYVSNYGKSTATLSTFQEACANIETQVTQLYNEAMGTTSTGSTSGSGSTTTGSTGSTTGTTTTGTTGVSPVTQQSQLANVVENGTWYVDWTSYNYPIPQGVNTVNIFVGNMSLDSSGNPTIGGFGTLSQDTSKLSAFVQACHAKGIAVKCSLGGSGGSYDNTWNVLTNDNVQNFAQSLADFCQKYQLDGVDFDCEEFTSSTDNPAQQALVGTLIKDFKTINPDFQTSLDTNAGFGSNYQWPGIAQNILNASLYTDPTTGKTACGIDRLYIMAYFNSMSDEQNWISGWANLMKTNYDFTPAQITVGLDPSSGAYDSNAFASWAASQGYSTSFWNYDPNNETQSNNIANGIFNAYNNS